MTSKEAIDYVRCAIGCGCYQVCNSKTRGDCTDAEVIEAKDLAIEALENQEILLETQRILLELLNQVDFTDEVCFEMDGEWCAEHCQNNKTGECYLEYCRVKREEKNERL